MYWSICQAMHVNARGQLARWVLSFHSVSWGLNLGPQVVNKSLYMLNHIADPDYLAFFFFKSYTPFISLFQPPQGLFLQQYLKEIQQLNHHKSLSCRQCCQLSKCMKTGKLSDTNNNFTISWFFTTLTYAQRIRLSSKNENKYLHVFYKIV